MTHNELKTLTTFAMFDIRTINTPNLESSVQHQLSMSSKSRFGVFVTVRRNENVFNLDNLDETQVHGCVGHWTNKYQPMTPSELTARIQQLAHEARFNDERRNNFSVDVDQDASAIIEINFMNLPLYEIDETTDEQSRFINDKQGVLVDSGSGKRATYLPGVYPNVSWKYISQSLRQKAGIGKNAAARFYAYDTTTVSFQIYNTLFSPFSESHLQTNIVFFYLQHYGNFVPYDYNSDTKKVTIDQRQDVRNVACIGDVISLSRDYRMAFEGKPILTNLEHYYQKWLRSHTEYRQMSIFLIRAYHLLGVHLHRIQLLSSKLYDAIRRNELEPKFELGQAVSVLSQVSVHRMNVLADAVHYMNERANDMLYGNTTTPLDNVFEMNWQSKSVYHLFKTEIDMASSRSSSVSNSSNASTLILKAAKTRTMNKHVDHAIILFRAFVKTAQRNILRLDSLETNYLAVIYEFLTNLDAIMLLYEKHWEHPNDDMRAVMHDEIRNQRLRYFSVLLKTRRGEYGLYYFKDGKHARLDITGHVLNLS